MIWIYITIALIVCLSIFLWPGIRALQITVDDFEIFLSSLLKRGYRDGELTFRPVLSRKKVLLRKYIHSRKKYGIELIFSNQGWSRSYFDLLLKYCEKKNLTYTISGAKGKEIIKVDFERDTESANKLVKFIFFELLKLDKCKRFSFLQRNLSLKDELIKSKNI